MRRFLPYVVGAVLTAASAVVLVVAQDDPVAPACNNYFRTPKEHRCQCNRATKCAKDRPAGEDTKCQRHCTPDKCKCLDPCTS